MMTILQEIKELRQNNPIDIDYRNNNRYRVLLQEDDYTKTAYYFSAPIYNVRTRKAVEMKFEPRDNTVYSVGSNANITISNEIRLENAEGFCVLHIHKDLRQIFEHELKYGEDVLLPTTNGVAYKLKCKGGESFSFDLEVGRPFMEVRTNDKYFALMSEKFKPFVSVSCIGNVNALGEVISPATVSYRKLSDHKYNLTITPCSPLGEWIMFEMNLYEPKLLQDTTVESENPKSNNAFGGIAFIGDTTHFGEQWLYAKLDFSKIPEMMEKRINKAILHLSKYNRSNLELSAFKVASRFCSFGSAWDNKIPATNFIANTSTSGKYQNLDITDFLTNIKTGYITRSEGIILKPCVRDNTFSAIATADNYYTPQILEINYC